MFRVRVAAERDIRPSFIVASRRRAGGVAAPRPGGVSRSAGPAAGARPPRGGGRRLRPGGGLALAAAALGTAVWAGGPAPAAAAPGLAVRPLFSGQTVLPAGHFTYALPAGARVRDAIVVRSTEPTPTAVSLYAADAVPAPGGGLGPASPGQPSHGVGGWLSVAPLPGRLRPGGEAVAAFTVRVPAAVAPGSYAGVLVARAAPATEAAGLAVGLQVGLLVEVRVVAAPRPALTVGPVQGAAAGPGLEDLSLVVQDRGNVNLGVAATVVVGGTGGRGGRRVLLGPAGLYVVPGGSAVLRGVSAWPPGVRRASATAVVTTTVGGQPGPAYTSPTALLTRPRQIPWAAAVPALLAAACIWLFAGGRRPRRGRGRPPA